MNYLIDTCAISEFFKPRPNENVLSWFKKNGSVNNFLSVITVGEIHKGAAKLADQSKQDQILQWLAVEILPQFEKRVIEIDVAIAAQWGHYMGVAKKRKLTLPPMDGYIAATAKTYNLRLITRNIHDFKHFDIELLNPWE